MPGMRAQVPEVNPADLFPAAQAKPISVGEAWNDLVNSEPELKYARSVIESRSGSVAPVLKRTKQGQQLSEIDGRGFYFNWQRLHPDRPSPTVPKEDINLCHPVEMRILTPTECKRLNSFPDEFHFAEDSKQKRAQIGNAVPPMMMRAVAGALAGGLFGRETMVLRLKDYANYKGLLGAAWGLHFAPREPGAPTVVSLFAGCGGSSLGYSMAGYRELLAVDFDERCAETFRANFPGVPFLVADIRKLTSGELMEEAGLSGPGELDVLDGSPPCQGFSTAGKRDLWDPRNELYREFARLLAEVRPKAFIMENVSGMVKGKMKLAFADCTRALKAAGYRVSCRLLDAKWFLVPQKRKRLIWVGVRGDLATGPLHPTAQARPVTLREALKDVSDDKRDQSNVSMMPRFDDKYAQLWDKIPVPSGKRLKSSAYEIIQKGFTSCVKPNPNMPCCTLPRQQTGRGFATITHWIERRALTIEEARRISSFPDDFLLDGDYSMQWRQIGNSVPPLFMRAIAQHIRQEILNKI